ncbi:MAG: hypothetical protein ACD_75C00947G0001 [uncultured bacterium]|nr:MAG: hypothetical protein ACD_75C00947G0001 [uncultured bacterium]
MGRRGGLAGIFAALAGATVNAAFRATRLAEAERNRQIRAAESYRNRLMRAEESDRQRQIRAEENEKRKVGNAAQRLANMVNKSIKIARSTPNLITKLNKLCAAQHIIEQLKYMAEEYPYLTLYELLPIESEIMQMQAETERNLQNIKIEKATVAAEKLQRERDKKKERQQRQTEKLAEKKRKDKLAQQKEFERQKLAVIRAKEKARIEADKIKEKQAKKERIDKLAQQKELERQKLTDERIREKARIAAEKAAIKLAEKERKDKLRVTLDKASIKAKRAETVAISAILKDIFAEDIPVTSQTASPDSTAIEVSIVGLDAESFSFMQALATKHIWARDELEKLATGHSLMLDGTLDCINDASYDHFGGPFFEGDDPIEINTEFAKEIAA